MSSERSLSREMVFLLLQFLKEEKFDETVHKLEKESGVFFNMRYFETLVTYGEWEEVEEYLSGFIKVDENRYFEIRKQKYLEALDNLNCQHALCKNAKLFRDIKTLFADHNCEEPDGVLAQSISANPGPSRQDSALSDLSSGDSNSYSLCTVDEDLPKNVVANLSHSSAVKSMDFHPLQQTVLVVGTNTGDIYVWEVGTRERLAWKPFQEQNLGNSIVMPQASLATKYTATASVNRFRWSADGCFLGVAYSKHIVHLYAYTSGDDLNNHLMIDAHVGSVNDLAFSHLNEHLCVITCGDDKKIKVWNAATGAKQHTLEGSEAPVYSVYPHYKDNIPFLYSTAIDGKIKIWLYDVVARVYSDATGHACMTMAYCSDGTRLFSSGTSKNGESHLVEWNEREGIVKRIYLGLGKYSVDIVQFDTTRNRFLAVGDECSVKYWDMDKVNLLGTVDADGGLELSPCIRFNKYGTLLAVSATGNGIKILANTEGAKRTCLTENQAGPVLPDMAFDVNGEQGDMPCELSLTSEADELDSLMIKADELAMPESFEESDSQFNFKSTCLKMEMNKKTKQVNLASLAATKKNLVKREKVSAAEGIKKNPGFCIPKLSRELNPDNSTFTCLGCILGPNYVIMGFETLMSCTQSGKELNPKYIKNRRLLNMGLYIVGSGSERKFKRVCEKLHAAFPIDREVNDIEQIVDVVKGELTGNKDKGSYIIGGQLGDKKKRLIHIRKEVDEPVKVRYDSTFERSGSGSYSMIAPPEEIEGDLIQELQHLKNSLHIAMHNDFFAVAKWLLL